MSKWIINRGIVTLFGACLCMSALRAQFAWSPAVNAGTSTLNGIDAISASSWVTVGNTGEIYTTTNGGASWILRNSTTQMPLNKICFATTTFGYVAADSGIILKSSNAGVTWARLTSGTVMPLKSISFGANQAGVVCGYNGTILSTVNAGGTWTAASVPVADQYEAVYMINATTGWVVGWMGIVIKTTDGGLTWNPQASNTSESLLSVDFVSTQVGACAGTNGKLLLTNNGGATWTPINPFTTDDIRSIKYQSLLNIYCSTSGGDIYYSSDGGANWMLTPSSNLDMFDFDVDVSSNTILTCGDLGAVQYGVVCDWYLMTGIPDARDLTFVNDTFGVAISVAGDIYRTVNGQTWDTILDTSAFFYYVECGTGAAVYAAANTDLYISHDSGNTWIVQPFTYTITDIEFLNDSVGFLIAAYNYKTTNGGLTWTQVTSNSNQTSVQFFDEDTGYVLSGKLYFTDDGGITLYPRFQGISHFQFTNKNVGVAWQMNTTEVYKTRNGGRSFHPLYVPASLDMVTAAYFTDSNTIYLAGIDNSDLYLYKSVDGGNSWTMQSRQQDSYSVNGEHRFAFPDKNRGYLTGASGLQQNVNTDVDLPNDPNWIGDGFIRESSPPFVYVAQSTFGLVNPTVMPSSIWQETCANINGNQLVAGTYRDGVNWGQFLTPWSSNPPDDLFISEVDVTGQPIRLKQFPLSSSGQVKSMKIDAAGNIYIGGCVTDSIYIDSVGYQAPGGNASFLMKLENDFDLVWFQFIDESDCIMLQSMCVDPAGNVYLSIYYGLSQPPTCFGHTFTAPSSAGFVKLDTNGNLVWANQNDVAEIASLDLSGYSSDGSVVFAGRFNDSIRVDQLAVVGMTQDDACILKLDGISGQAIWMKAFNGNVNFYLNSLALDSNANVFLSGHTAIPVEFDTLQWVFPVYTWEGFIVKLNSQGATSWITTQQNALRTYVTTDRIGNLYASWHCTSGARIADSVLDTVQNIGRAAIICRMDSSGRILWFNSLRYDVTGVNYPEMPLELSVYDTSIVYCVATITTYGFDSLGISMLQYPNSWEQFGVISRIDYGPSPVSVSESPQVNAGTSYLEIFPSPASSIVYINVGPITEGSRLEIYNGAGEIIFCNDLSLGLNSIDVTGFAPGIYFAVLKDSFSLQSQRFVIQR